MSAALTNDALLQQQRALLLHQLNNTPEGKFSLSDANKTIPKQLKSELKLTATALKSLRQSMVQSGWLVEEKIARNVTYAITEVGKQQLRELERYLPLLPAGGKLNLSTDERVRVARDVYVLNALFRAPSQTISKADLEVGFGGKGKPKVAELAAKHPHLAPFRGQICLGLNPATTRAVLTALALDGDIVVHRTADAESYSLTPSGVARLARLRSEYPVLPPTGKPTAAPNESVRLGRAAFLLLKLLQSTKHTFWESDAALGSYPKPLKLNHATAWRARGELAAEGHIATDWDGKEGSYTLTPSGKRRLASLPFDALGEVKIKGSALTELLAAAREGTKATTPDTTAPTEPQAPGAGLTGARLETAVMGVFHELLGGPYANLRMVPIHEIRETVAGRFGSDAASPDVFDECLLALRRTDKVRLVPLDNRSQATPDQLRHSVSAVGQTFFYAEKAHAPAQSG